MRRLLKGLGVLGLLLVLAAAALWLFLFRPPPPGTPIAEPVMTSAGPVLKPSSPSIPAPRTRRHKGRFRTRESEGVLERSPVSSLRRDLPLDHSLIAARGCRKPSIQRSCAHGETSSRMGRGGARRPRGHEPNRSRGAFRFAPLPPSLPQIAIA